MKLLRPEENSDLTGHEAAEQALMQAWHSGRFAHAWLVGGPRGIGKATLGCRLARFVLAATGRGEGSLYIPPDHPTFRRIAAGGHADFRLVARGIGDSGKRRTQIVVDDIREVGRFLTLTADESGWRVVVIDEAETMNDSAANAVLKMLEEPPPRALLVLVSHSPGRLLPTVRSRCRRLALRPLAEGQVATLLARHRPALAPAEALAVARLAEGSIGRALELAEDDGVALYQSMVDLLAGMPRLDGGTLHAFGERIAQGGDRLFVTWTELFRALLVRMARRGVTGQPLAEAVPGEEILAARLTSVVGLDRWGDVWEKTTHLFGRTESLNLDRKQIVLNAFLAVGRLFRG
ncbi:MAG: DNA polymerase III subunit delta' [Rhodospirillaceae bacterium]|nr:MAG: DNA polymerase III subunit delta' [Rhodospirillaceae bacterium]